jgi:hypothetical protein
MSRLGYARLDQYGLELALDGRVRSMHRTVHDDGGGGLIVGWLTDDLGVAQLPEWRATPPPPPEDEWDAVIARARVQAAVVPDFVGESATVEAPQVVAAIAASIVSPPPVPRHRLPAPSKPIPHLRRRATPPPPPPARTAKGTEPHRTS